MLREKVDNEPQEETKGEDRVSKDMKYLVIDIDKFHKSSQIYSMIRDVELLLINEKKLDEDVPIAWINTKLRNSAKYNNFTNDQLHGGLWTSIRKKKTLIRSMEKIPHSLVYWNKKDVPFVCFTS
jgi:hypothetical protein